jgi:hypothetical protein
MPTWVDLKGLNNMVDVPVIWNGSVSKLVLTVWKDINSYFWWKVRQKLYSGIGG